MLFRKDNPCSNSFLNHPLGDGFLLIKRDFDTSLVIHYKYGTKSNNKRSADTCTSTISSKCSNPSPRAIESWTCTCDTSFLYSKNDHSYSALHCFVCDNDRCVCCIFAWTTRSTVYGALPAVTL